MTQPVVSPAVGDTVHYVSHGTPVRSDGTQAYTSRCRAAIVTDISYYDPECTVPTGAVSLCVLNPTGQFFNEHVEYDDGAGRPGDPNCQRASTHGNPFRYCLCGWTEDEHRGGTWHHRPTTTRSST